MYRIKTIEKAILLRGYNIEEFFVSKGFVRKVEGKVNDEEVVWDATGHCFSRTNNTPLPQFNLPLNEMYIDIDARGIASIHNIYQEDLELLLRTYSSEAFGDKIRAIAKQVKNKPYGKLSAIRHQR